jgi:hypothetical protein
MHSPFAYQPMATQVTKDRYLYKANDPPDEPADQIALLYEKNYRNTGSS